jgi:flagellin
MNMVVQHNMQAMNTNRQLGITTSAQSKSTEKLSSGYKINRASDDAAGLSISEKMRSQIRGLNKASSNAQDGVSLIQTAEGALNETHSILQRMNELATQAANDTNTTSDRNAIQSEMNQLASEINRISSTTQFNTQNLLDGSFTGKNLQVGSLSGQTIQISISAMSAGALFGTGGTAAKVVADLKVGSTSITASTGDDAGNGNTLYDDVKATVSSTTALYDAINVSSFSAAGTAMTFVQAAIEKVSDMRSTLGSVQNRLEHTIANLDTTAENTQSAESQIRDTDIAEEMVTYSKNNILAQAGQSMLAQANQSTQGALSLLG